MGTVSFQDTTIEGEVLTRRGERAARALERLGVGRDDVVALMLRNTPRFIEALGCVNQLQATRVLLPWPLAEPVLTRILAQVGATMLLIDVGLLPLARAAILARPNLKVVVIDDEADGWGSPALPGFSVLRWHELIADVEGGAADALPPARGPRTTVTLTSGSTGVPKVIRRTDAGRWRHWYRFSSQDRPRIRSSVVTAPLFNSGQYGVFSQTWYQQADIVLLEAFDPEAFLALVEARRINHAYLIPGMFVQLLRLPAATRRRYDVSSLEYVVHTGGPCPAHIKARMIDWWGPVIWEAYGCSETSLIAECSPAEWLERPSAVGRPILPVAILDPGGGPLPPGEVGRIHVGMDGLPRVTVDGQEPSWAAWEGRRWLATGDSGYLDEAGYLHVVCRNDEQINVGGTKVYPIEVEGVLLRHPAVVDCVACALPHEDLGSTVGAAVQLRPGGRASEAQLRDFAGRFLPAGKVPSRITVVAAPLRPATGKVNRRRVADQMHIPAGVPAG